MDISLSPGADDRGFPSMGSATAANSSFLVTPIRPSTTSTPISASASTSDTNTSTFDSAAVTPLGTSVPTMTATILFLLSVGNAVERSLREISGISVDQTVASVMLHHAQRSTDLFNATVVDQHAGRPSSSHSIQPFATAGNSPTHSTETLRPRLVP